VINGGHPDACRGPLVHGSEQKIRQVLFGMDDAIHFHGGHAGIYDNGLGYQFNFNILIGLL
jgi:hypothetical protein